MRNGNSENSEKPSLSKNILVCIKRKQGCQLFTLLLLKTKYLECVFGESEEVHENFYQIEYRQ